MYYIDMYLLFVYRANTFNITMSFMRTLILFSSRYERHQTIVKAHKNKNNLRTKTT